MVSDHEKWRNYVRELREYLISAERFYTYDILEEIKIEEKKL